jgi:hypothetical protein
MLAATIIRARIDREGAPLDAAPIDVLDQRRLAGALVDREQI